MKKSYIFIGIAIVIVIIIGVISLQNKSNTNIEQQASVGAIMSSGEDTASPRINQRKKRIIYRGEYCVIMTGRHIDCVAKLDNGMCPGPGAGGC